MKRLTKITIALAVSAFLFTGCNCYNKMEKKAGRITTTCTPEVLSLKGKQVSATYTVQFPAKYFDELAIVRATPVLVYEGGEFPGAPKYLQGEFVKDNYTVISWKNGGSYTQTVTFPYSPSMRPSNLIVRIEAKCKSNCSKKDHPYELIAEIAVAPGVSTLQEFLDDYAKLAYAPDNFKRNTTLSQDAKVMFLINKSDVRKAQLDSEELVALQNFVIENQGDPKSSVGNLYTKAYASPDGPLNFNDKLSQSRATNTTSAISKKFSANTEKGIGSLKNDVESLGEDWEGFQELVSASDIPDKDLILQVLKMYSSPEKRDQEIKNMTAVFKILAEKILPELRRSRLTVNVDKMGLTDAELKDAVKSNISNLNCEELLFAATLFNDPATKAKIYKTAADKYNDYRAWNNLGVALAEECKVNEAKLALLKAAQLNNSSNEVVNNLGVIALSEGNYAEARKYLSSINTPDSKYNTGLLDATEGNYAEAVKSLDGYNLAVAELLNGNLAKAKTLLATDNSANADYLKAVIAAREGNFAGVNSNLKSAFAKDPSLKAYAANDIEFAKCCNEPEFIVIIK